MGTTFGLCAAQSNSNTNLLIEGVAAVTKRKTKAAVLVNDNYSIRIMSVVADVLDKYWAGRRGGHVSDGVSHCG